MGFFVLFRVVVVLNVQQNVLFQLKQSGRLVLTRRERVHQVARPVVRVQPGQAGLLVDELGAAAAADSAKACAGRSKAEVRVWPGLPSRWRKPRQEVQLILHATRAVRTQPRTRCAHSRGRTSSGSGSMPRPARLPNEPRDRIEDERLTFDPALSAPMLRSLPERCMWIWLSVDWISASTYSWWLHRRSASQSHHRRAPWA